MWKSISFALLFLLLLAGCGSNHGSLPVVPQVASVAPTTIVAGSGTFILTVVGSGFTASSQVQWNAAPCTTTFVNSQQLTCSIPASNIASQGTISITVYNPGPPSSTSNVGSFTVNAPVPAITSISPTTTSAGGQTFTLTVNGSNFVANSSVRWNGNNRTTTFVNSSKLTATIPDTDIASAGTGSVTVATAAPGGGTTSSATLTITAPNPVPTIGSLSPNTAVAGSAALTLTINGTGFLASSSVQWNGSALTTTFVNSTQLTATIPAANLASEGGANVTVVNAAPGGGTSSAAPFTITANSPAPILSSISPTSVLAGSPAFTLTANGSNYVSGSVVRWAGSARPTTYVNNTQLTAVIAAADVASAGGVAVTVLNPDEKVSDEATLTISTVTVGAFSRISVATDNTQGDRDTDYEGEAVTPDGRFVIFSSATTTIVPVQEQYNWTNVYLRDTCRGAAGPCNPSTTLISAKADGSVPSWDSRLGALTPDGRYVAFYSSSYDLLPGDTNNSGDVFLRDTCIGAPAGCTPSTSIVSLANDGSQFGYSSNAPAISASGRYIAFRSMTMASPSKYAIFVRDTCIGAPSGCVPSTDTVASDISNGYYPDITPDGRYVAYDDSSHVWVADTCNGAPEGCATSTTLVSINPDGTIATGTNGGELMRPDARYVVFYNYVFISPNYYGTVMLRDTCIGAVGACTPSTSVVSVGDSGQQGNNMGVISLPSMSLDARFVAFNSDSSNLVTGDTNNQPDIFVRDTCLGAAAGCTPTTVRVSLASNGAQGATMPGIGHRVITSDGHVIVFDSGDAMVPQDTNNRRDVYIGLTSY